MAVAPYLKILIFLLHRIPCLNIIFFQNEQIPTTQKKHSLTLLPPPLPPNILHDNLQLIRASP